MTVTRFAHKWFKPTLVRPGFFPEFREGGWKTSSGELFFDCFNGGNAGAKAAAVKHEVVEKFWSALSVEESRLAKLAFDAARAAGTLTPEEITARMPVAYFAFDRK